MRFHHSFSRTFSWNLFFAKNYSTYEKKHIKKSEKANVRSTQSKELKEPYITCCSRSETKKERWNIIYIRIVYSFLHAYWTVYKSKLVYQYHDIILACVEVRWNENKNVKIERNKKTREFFIIIFVSSFFKFFLNVCNFFFSYMQYTRVKEELSVS